jgi:hypothetical protein
MSDKSPKREVPRKKGMSFEPQTIGTDGEGKHVVIDDNPYIALNSASHGWLYYCPRDNAYYASDTDNPMPDDLFSQKFLPQLRWNFDKFEEDEVEVVDPMDQRGIRKIKVERLTSTFPPTPANIAAVREGMIKSALAAGATPDMQEIWAKTSPTHLELTDKDKLILDSASPSERLLRKINKSF